MGVRVARQRDSLDGQAGAQYSQGSHRWPVATQHTSSGYARNVVEPTRETLLTCLRIERWASDLSGRAYSTMLELERAAVAAATPLSTAEIDEALAAHESGAEVPDDPALARRLTDGNAKYQQQFGWPFVIREQGRSAEEIVTALERRIDNGEVVEVAEIANQLRGIALLRLRAAYADQFAATS